MTTNSNANGAAMIGFLVFVAPHVVKASSINICLHVRLFFYLHIMLVDMSLATMSISVALSYCSIKGVFIHHAASVDNQARKTGCLSWPFESARLEVAGK